MAGDLYTTVAECATCEQNESQYSQATSTVVPSKGRLEFVPIEILLPLHKTFQGSRYVLVITDHYSKQTRAMKKSMTTDSHVANLCLCDWVLIIGITTYLCTDNQEQLVGKFS